MLRIDDTERTVEIGVHDLIDTGPKQGHLSLQVAWSARTRMRAGQEVHSNWQTARAEEDADFRREVTLRRRVVVRDWECRIQGRVDGLSTEGDHTVVEEVKSTTLTAEMLAKRTLSDFPDWARQVHLYLWFLAGEGTPAVGRLVLVSLLDGSQRVLHVAPDPHIGDWVVRQLEWLLLQHEDRMAWRARRMGAPVPFPHSTYRPGQEQLIDEVTEALAGGRRLLLQAPTGYGKTVAALQAALLVARDTGQRVFFATARTTQQRMAEETVREMARRGLPIRAVTLRARERVCLNSVVACRPDACTYAEHYHDKVRETDIVSTLWALGAGPEAPGVPPPDRVLQVAGDATVCPFAVSLDLVASADVVIGDLNYVFDPSVRLAEVGDRPREWLVIVDEAHNLPERALDAASPELRLSVADAAADALRTGPHASRWGPFAQLAEDVADWLRAGVARVPGDARDGEFALPVDEGVDRRTLDELAQRVEGLALDYALIKLTHPPFPPGTPDLWLDLGRAVLRARTAGRGATEATMAIWRAPKRRRTRSRTARPRRTNQTSLLQGPSVAYDPADLTGLKLLHRDPASILGPLFRDLGGVVCMSATLSPDDFYRRVLGIDPDKIVRLDHPSPFPPEHRRVIVCPEVSTAWRDRDRDRPRTAELVSDAIRCVPGNVAVFCPSFAFLESLAPLLETGDRPILVQHRGMKEAERTAFLETMKRGEGHALLAVLGGIFSEGIDLPGEGLLAAVIVGPSLPAATLERRLLQDWYQSEYGEGFRYAWLVPGMSRVVQAAGRIIRTETDVGAIVLIGRRFVQQRYASLLPEDWAPKRSSTPGADLLDHWDHQHSGGEEPHSLDAQTRGEPEPAG